MDESSPTPEPSGRPSGPTWLTYVELGQLLGTTADAARQKAVRGRWRKQRGNDGKARVLVEPEVLEAVQTRPARQPAGDDQAAVQVDAVQVDVQLVTLLEGQISYLKGLADSERARADRLQEELLSLAKSHTVMLERYANREPERRPWWRRLTG
jgi:hypothetical protein